MTNFNPVSQASYCNVCETGFKILTIIYRENLNINYCAYAQDTGLKINGRPSSLQKEPSNQRFTRKDLVHLNPLADVSNLIFVQICREPGNGHMEKELIYRGYYPYSTLIQPPIPAQPRWYSTWNSFCSDLIQNPFLPNLGSSASPNQ